MSKHESGQYRPRVLMIAPEFYPAQMISAHRSGKFCKYLPQFGYDVSVLTVNPREAGWAVDDRLSDQIPPSTQFIEAFYPFGVAAKGWASLLQRQLQRLLRRTARRSSAPAKPTSGELVGVQAWLVPDKAILWTPWALVAGLDAARRADVLYATGPAFSTLVIAALLKRLTRRPLIIDLRDPWTISELRTYPRPFHCWLDQRLERMTFRPADAIICNTEAVRAAYRECYPELPRSRFTVISNGYDEDDLASLPQSKRMAGKVRLGYFGKVYAGRDPGPLLRAARKAITAGQIAPESIEFVFYGPSSDLVAAAARAADATSLISLHPTVPYAEALKQMAACDVLMILSSPETDHLHIPGKTFEYLAMGKPILALAGPGSLDDLMKRYHFGLRISPEDADGISNALLDLCRSVMEGATEKYLGSAGENLTRRRLTGELADLFDQVISHRKADQGQATPNA